MNADLIAAVILELGVGAVLLLVFVLSLFARGADRRWLAGVALGGVLAVGLLSLVVTPAPPRLGGMFVQDGLAIFAKRLFLCATAISLLAGLGAPPASGRRAGE